MYLDNENTEKIYKELLKTNNVMEVMSGLKAAFGPKLVLVDHGSGLPDIYKTSIAACYSGDSDFLKEPPNLLWEIKDEVFSSLSQQGIYVFDDPAEVRDFLFNKDRDQFKALDQKISDVAAEPYDDHAYDKRLKSICEMHQPLLADKISRFFGPDGKERTIDIYDYDRTDIDNNKIILKANFDGEQDTFDLDLTFSVENINKPENDDLSVYSAYGAKDDSEFTDADQKALEDWTKKGGVRELITNFKDLFLTFSNGHVFNFDVPRLKPDEIKSILNNNKEKISEKKNLKR